jgi:polar amino acid transport system substrate-binding protein
MRKNLLLLILALGAILWTLSGSVTAAPVELAVDEANPPFMYKDDTGKAAGLYPEMAKVIFEKIGSEVNVLPYPWKRVLQLSEAGEVGVIGIYKNDKRLEIYDYSEALFDDKIMVYTKADTTFAFAGTADLKGKKVGVINGWSYGSDFDQLKESGELTAEGTSADELNFKKLNAGRLDCLLAIEQSGDAIIKKLNLTDKITKVTPPLVVNSTYLVFAKSSNQQELLDKINQAISDMKGDGSYDQMIETIFNQAN